jgi:large subunit ribosomal protein L24
MKIRKNDTVIVITGKDKGKEAKVVRALPKEGKVIVDGVNVKKKSQKARKSGAKGQIIDKPMPIDVSNVMLLDPKSKKRTRTGFDIKDGKKTRIARKSGSAI